MAITRNTDTSTGGQFTADKDYHGTTEDGRSFLKVAAGVTIPMAEAIELGVVKAPKAAEKPAEKADAPKSNKAEKPAEKADAPKSNKAEKPAENKGSE